MITYKVKELTDERVSQGSADTITAKNAMVGISLVWNKLLLSENIRKKESFRLKTYYLILSKQPNGRKTQSLFPKHLKNQL